MEQTIADYIPELYKPDFLKLTSKEIADIITEHLSKKPVYIKEEYHEIKKSIPVSETPVYAGITGENYIFDGLQKLNGDYSVKLRNKEKNKGDMWIKYKPVVENQVRIYRIMVDVKNYSSSVPTRELTKFISDFETNEADAGILISLNTKITGHGDFGMKYITKDNKRCPVIFIRTSDIGLICQYVYFISLQIVNRDYKKTYDDELEKLLEMSEMISETCNSIEETRKVVDKQLMNLYKNILKLKLSFEMSIKNLGKLKSI